MVFLAPLISGYGKAAAKELQRTSIMHIHMALNKARIKKETNRTVFHACQYYIEMNFWILVYGKG